MNNEREETGPERRRKRERRERQRARAKESPGGRGAPRPPFFFFEVNIYSRLSVKKK